MTDVMTRLFLILACMALLLPAADKDGWVSMFDGKTLDGWKANEHPECWTVEDGALKGSTGRSHLFWMKEECVNCEFKATVKLAKGSNSGMYVRTEFGPGFPKGYEAQVNNSHTDPVRTGSLYNIVKVYDQLIGDDTWWTQHIVINGNHIIVKVNDKVVVDHIEERNLFKKGYIALQQHDPKSTVWYKDLMFKKLK
jgi:hypothetical protein